MDGYTAISPKAPAGDETVTVGQACQIIGCGNHHLEQLRNAGRIGVWSVANSRLRYSRKDCERIRDEAFKPATATG